MRRTVPVRNALQRSPPARWPPSRRGAILLLAMVCLIVMSAVGNSLVRSAIVQRRQVQHEEARLQCEWLAEAGLERAVARLKADSAYAGDTWEPPPEQLFGKAGRVIVRVEADDGAGKRTLVATAESSPGTPQHVRTTRRISLDHEHR